MLQIRPRVTQLCALLAVAFAAPAHAGATFFDFGAAAGDSKLEACDDCFKQTSFTGIGIAGSSLQTAFYGKGYNSLYVNNNGLVSFGSGVDSYSPSPFPVSGMPAMIAPYWVDVDTRGNQGSVWYRSISDQSQLGKLDAEINRLYLGVSAFNPTFAEVVTWDHVTTYPYSTPQYHIDPITHKQVLNTSTFQMLLVSDGIQTFTIFKYLQDGMWATMGTASGGVYPGYGFQDGYGNYYNGTGSRSVFMQSRNNTGVSIDTSSNSHPGSPGDHIWQISPGTLPADVMVGAYSWAGGSGTWAGTFSGNGGATFGGTAGEVKLSAAGFGRRLVVNTSGYTFTADSAAKSLQLDNLQVASADTAVTFGGKLVLLTHAGIGGMSNDADAKQLGVLTRGKLTFTDDSVLVARDAGMINGADIILKSNAQLQIWTAGASTRASTLSFDGGTLDLRGLNTSFGKVGSLNRGAGTIKNSGTSASTLTIDFDGGASEYSGTIQGAVGITKAGSGVQTLRGAYSYTGPTLVNGGELRINGSATSAFTVASGATLGGNGTIGKLTLNGKLSPGNSPGQLNAGDTTFAGGSTYLWQINDANGVAGVGYDFLSVNGKLTLAGSSGSPITIALQSLLANDSAGNVFNFDATHNYSYTLATASGGILGYSANGFLVDGSGFSNALHGGVWSVGLAGNELQLNFTAAAVPEPSTYGMLLAGLAGIGFIARRRRVAAA